MLGMHIEHVCWMCMLGKYVGMYVGLNRTCMSVIGLCPIIQCEFFIELLLWYLWNGSNAIVFVRSNRIEFKFTVGSIILEYPIITSRLISRDVLSPLTRSLFHGHETTQLLNNYKNYDDEIYTVTWNNLSRCQLEKNELSSCTGYWDIWPEPQAPKGLNSYFFHFISFCFFCSSWNYVFCSSHNWSKISSNQADFLHTHRGVKNVPGDA